MLTTRQLWMLLLLGAALNGWLAVSAVMKGGLTGWTAALAHSIALAVVLFGARRLYRSTKEKDDRPEKS